ncbi:transcription factor IBH1-like [Phragmites australis]|uniref:transcription factor IBH1-like n=1 Tax=Phragmites australis TaxID=29695 RepID=UPI002D77298F|nr:transcription factor IBH1-like [Phragmites australis]
MEGKRPPCHRRRRRRSAERAVGRKVRELRRLVPGGAAVPADRLLLRTADYIVRLRARVELLRALSELIPVTTHGGGHADGEDDAPLAS